MNNRYIMYVLISLFCIFAIIAGIYAEFIDGGAKEVSPNGEPEIVIVEKDAETIKKQFDELFTNTINLNGYDTSRLNKIDESKEIVYSSYDFMKEGEFYEVNLKIPYINIETNVANSFNTITKLNFENKAVEIMLNKEESKKSIYNIDYVAIINDNILSVVIRSTLKGINHEPKVELQTYNYNLVTGEKVELIDLITTKMLNKEDVNNKIIKAIQQADLDSKDLQNMGDSDIYIRDLTDTTKYSVDGANSYFLGPNNELYIIYPYGNDEFTSEMDIVLFE